MPRLGIALVAVVLHAAIGQAVPLRVMSFNTWLAGTEVTDGPQKAIDAIGAANADVVGLQETGGHLATTIATSLGWHALQGPGSVAIVSRFPITEVFALARDASGLGVRLRVSEAPDGDVVVWVVHLGYTGYGPYAACAGEAPALLRRGESSSGRVRQIKDVLRRMRRHLLDADTVPVLLLGDFNAPSHLDWGPAAASLHCGVTMAWPVSSRVERARMLDLFRAVFPDPLAIPGDTWSTVYPAPEPQDRIDFVYARGAGVVPIAAERFVTGTPAAYPGHAGNEWPSDHAAVVATVDVTPAASLAGRAPQLALDRSLYGASDPIVATVGFGPANGGDWIGLYRVGDAPGVEAASAWRYLNGTQSATRRGRSVATVTFPAGTLLPGAYVAYFFYADGYGALSPAVAFTIAG